MTTHAEIIHLSAHDPKRLIVPKPPRKKHFWDRMPEERECRKLWGHCYHPYSMIEWFCCMCGHESEGMPEDNCKICRTNKE